MTDQQQPKSFFKESDLKSVSACSGLTWLICTALYQLLPALVGIKAIPFAIAHLVSLIRSFHEKPFSIKELIFSVLNGFIIFIGALGISGALNSVSTTSQAELNNPPDVNHNQVSQQVDVNSRPPVFFYWYADHVEPANKK